MKKMLLILILLPIIILGQSVESINAFKKSIPDSLGKPVRLPEPGFNRELNIEEVAYYVKQRIYIITADSVYRNIFWNYRFTKDSLLKYATDKKSWYYTWMVEHLVDSLPVIDFSKKELVVYSACGQCLTFCEHRSGNKSCHRNVCRFMYKWFVRDGNYTLKNATGLKIIFL